MKNKIICDQCLKEFPKKPNHIKRTSHNFCSRECYSIFKTKDKIHKKCYCCNADLFIEPRYIKKSKTGLFFCNSSCAASYNNTLKRRSRRSKIEIKFYNLLVKEFPNLDILPNDKTMLNGYEVDISIPELKLAIEWNGIVHFKPIYGEDTFFRVKKNDTKKLEIASNKDINLIVISDLVSNDKILQKAFMDVKTIIEDMI